MKYHNGLYADVALAAAKARTIYLSDVKAMKSIINPNSQQKIVKLNNEPCEVIDLTEYRAKRKKLV